MVVDPCDVVNGTSPCLRVLLRQMPRPFQPPARGELPAGRLQQLERQRNTPKPRRKRNARGGGGMTSWLGGTQWRSELRGTNKGSDVRSGPDALLHLVESSQLDVCARLLHRSIDCGDLHHHSKSSKSKWISVLKLMCFHVFEYF